MAAAAATVTVAQDGPALDKSKLDYSLYLITARAQIHPSFLPSPTTTAEGPSNEEAHIQAYLAHLDKILASGTVTLLQLREKDAVPAIENRDFLKLAQRSLEVCDKYHVPMLINDNVAVALALPQRVGLHIGQSDLPLAQARKLLGPNRLIGISTKNPDQVYRARLDGADYVGIGALYGTASKPGIVQGVNTLGPRGAAKIVAACHAPIVKSSSTENGFVEASEKDKEQDLVPTMPCVVIGGINRQTAARSLFATVRQSSRAGAPPVAADGIAVISDIYANKDPVGAAKQLAATVKEFKQALHTATKQRLETISAPLAMALPPAGASAKADLLQRIQKLFTAHVSESATPPLIQTITSHVSATLSANVALSFHASPIMSHEAEEAEDLSAFTGGVVLNIGTIGPPSREGMRAVGKANNLKRKPVVLDPVGGGASAFRKAVVEEILNHTQVTLIKGNSAELSSLAGLSEVQSRGVDAGPGQLSDPVKLVQTLAQRERCLVLLTGKKDYLSDGVHTVTSDNGHPLLGSITGSGCSLGVALAAGMARACASSPAPKGEGVANELSQLLVNCASTADLFAGALMGLLTITIASEIAAENPLTKGPGTFIPHWLDAIANMDAATLVKRAKIEVL